MPGNTCTKTVGIIGTGIIAATMHIPVLRALGTVDIRWATDANAARGRRIARANGLEFVDLPADPASLPPCDLVALAIPLVGRDRYLAYYATTGTAVVAEKPLAITATEHAAAAAAFDPWRLNVCYIRRTYATSRLLRECVLSGIFGELREVVVAEGGRGTRTGGGGGYQDEPVAAGGGIVKNLGCHSLDLVLWATGAKSFRIEHRAIEWDGATDRHCDASIVLQDVAGSAGRECALRLTLSWLAAQSNTVTFRFDRADVVSPIAPSLSVDVLGREARRIGTLQPACGGATLSNQAYGIVWSQSIAALERKRESEVSARSCQPAADLMDALLAR